MDGANQIKNFFKKPSILKSFKDWMSKVIVNMSCVKIFLDYF